MASSGSLKLLSMVPVSVAADMWGGCESMCASERAPDDCSLNAVCVALRKTAQQQVRASWTEMRGASVNATICRWISFHYFILPFALGVYLP